MEVAGVIEIVKKYPCKLIKLKKILDLGTLEMLSKKLKEKYWYLWTQMSKLSLMLFK